MNEWEQVPIAADVTGYAQLPYSARHFLIAYAVGPQHLRRRPGSLREAMGSPIEIEDDFAQDIFELYDGALALAGIPPIPPGYVWFIRLPSGVRDGGDFWARVDDLARSIVEPLDGGTWESQVAVLEGYKVALRNLYDN